MKRFFSTPPVTVGASTSQTAEEKVACGFSSVSFPVVSAKPALTYPVPLSRTMTYPLYLVIV